MVNPETRNLGLSNLRISAAPYLGLMFVSVVLSLFVHYLAPIQPTVKGQPFAVWTQFVLFSAAFALWVVCERRRIQDRWLTWFLGLAFLAWLVIMAIGFLDGELFVVTALLFGPALLMIWWKPPKEIELITAVDLAVWAIILVSFASQVLDLAGIRAMPQEFLLRWPVLTEIVGMTSRWEGPFGNVNFAGPVGALVLVYGCTRTSWRRLTFVAAGALILLASEARTSMAAAAAGVGILFLFRRSYRELLVPLWFRLAGFFLGGVVLFVIFVGPDSDLNSRTPVWSSYWNLWESSPLLGIGSSGIRDAISSGLLPGWASHAHNELLDTLVRFGLIGVSAVIAMLSVGIVITLLAARWGHSRGAALLITFMVGGLSETNMDWRYLSIQGIALITAVLFSWAALKPPSRAQDVRT